MYIPPEYKIFQIQMFHCQGPKFVSDEEIERIKAKIEEDNKAIAALDIKNERQKYGKNWELRNAEISKLKGLSIVS